MRNYWTRFSPAAIARWRKKNDGDNMSNLKFNISLIIVIIVFCLAALGINYIANAIGLPDGVADTVGYLVLLGLLILYLVYRQKEGNEVVKTKEENARLNEQVRKQSETIDYLKQEYSFYRNEYWKLNRKKDSDNGQTY